MLLKRHFGAGCVVPRHGLGENREVARFLDVVHRAEYQPHRIVVESAADVVVAPAGEGLVLVVAPAVLELRGGDVEDALPCTVRHLMHEPHQVLVRIAETHAPAYAAFEIAGRAREAERDHTLVLVPDVDHPVEPRLAALDAERAEQPVPIGAQLLPSLGHGLCGGETGDDLVRLAFVDQRDVRCL